MPLRILSTPLSLLCLVALPAASEPVSEEVQAAASAAGVSVATAEQAVPVENASAPELTAFEVVEDTTNRVMAVVIAAEDYVDDDPESYYNKIQGLLDPLIDYRGFSRSVMGPYASSQRYRSLDEAGREELKDQLDRFTEVMRRSLVRTYSKGLLAFGGSRIEVIPTEDDVVGSSRIAVLQHVFADRDEPYEVLYQMARDKTGNWKLRNVIIESVNLGEIYRDQFQASAREEKGDLENVIANWTVVTVDVES